MMLRIPQILDAEQLAACRTALNAASWSESAPGRRYLPEDAPAARAAGDLIYDALGRHPTFFSAALPLTVLPPCFDWHAGDAGLDPHVDDAFEQIPDTRVRVRCDLGATLFLADPDSYDGGEVHIEDTYGAWPVKLPAGDLVLYPAAGRRRIAPVTRGARVVARFCIHSMIRSDTERTLLFELDADVQRLGASLGVNDATVVRLGGLYHNLLRRWSQT